ncbi:MAG TPA: hypothetical protein VFH92_06830 [Phenylobacterium sp.]|nr:hypothetical protein [Phenylobacterium sp.]
MIAAWAGLGVILAAALGLYWKGRIEGAARERPKVEAAVAQATVAKLETAGAADSAQRVEVVIRQHENAARAVAQLTESALKSEDAYAPLDPGRLDRLRADDVQLCLAAPDLAGCAEAGHAGRGDPSL